MQLLCLLSSDLPFFYNVTAKACSDTLCQRYESRETVRGYAWMLPLSHKCDESRSCQEHARHFFSLSTRSLAVNALPKRKLAQKYLNSSVCHHCSRGQSSVSRRKMHVCPSNLQNHVSDIRSVPLALATPIFAVLAPNCICIDTC